MKGLLDTIGAVIHLTVEGINPAEHWPCEPCIEHLHDGFVLTNLPVSYEPLAPEDAVYADHWTSWMNKNSDDALMRLGVFGSVGTIDMLFAIDSARLYLENPYTVPGKNGGTVFVFRIQTSSQLLIADGTLSFEADSKVAARLSEYLDARRARYSSIFADDLVDAIEAEIEVG
jgi:hypothetical protein